ncbi:hypothetical protein OPV22_022545 [Ensete ventricosum]|uniref:Uncharacterized protein n=1 Tax=Ensete ventricosum TaxID=4639 RepID=A0AAV8QNQ8_ENSVE|nr:hypothetical protein OPV22_022545 [Ensete ventricosum]
MSFGSKPSVSCADARWPVRPSYRWPESDAKFVKSMAGRGERGNHRDRRKKWSPYPMVVDSYSCRQMYLRSYTFSKEETVTEKARRCLMKVKDRAALLFPFLQHNSASGNEMNRRNSRRKKKKGCGTDRKLRETSYSALFSVFYLLLLCTAGVEVADRR